MVIDPRLSRLIMLIHGHTVRRYDYKPPRMVEVRQRLMNLLVSDCKLMQWHNGIILVQHQVVNFLLIHDFFHHTEVVNHRCGSELIEVKQ